MVSPGTTGAQNSLGGFWDDWNLSGSDGKDVSFRSREDNVRSRCVWAENEPVGPLQGAFGQRPAYAFALWPNMPCVPNPIERNFANFAYGKKTNRYTSEVRLTPQNCAGIGIGGQKSSVHLDKLAEELNEDEEKAKTREKLSVILSLISNDCSKPAAPAAVKETQNCAALWEKKIGSSTATASPVTASASDSGGTPSTEGRISWPVVLLISCGGLALLVAVVVGMIFCFGKDKSSEGTTTTEP